jgi:tyrosyl-tRNA synthetase
MTSNDPQKIHTLLNRGVENVLPNKDFVNAKLVSGEKLKIYLGIDPTGPTLHIGHAIALKKLAHFQNLGHEIILLMGDFTARIGDPTDKLATRVSLTAEQVMKNLKNYKQQASKIISFEGENPAQVKFNSEWLGSMNFSDVLELASKVTVQQMIERDMFQKRIEEGKPIYIHEFMYPLMQGKDSVAMGIDGEIGGNDQLFNMLMGRTLMKEYGKEKFVLVVKLLSDSSGKKMGKSEGNMVALDDSADEMYGKIMSWTDGMVIGGFELCTDISEDEILDMEVGMQNGENPMQYKKRLAREIVSIYHNEHESLSAQDNWEKTFSEGGVPGEIPEFLAKTNDQLVEVLLMNNIIDSKSEFRRLVEEGAVKIMNESSEVKITDIKYLLSEGLILKIGKKKFVKIVI